VALLVAIMLVLAACGGSDGGGGGGEGGLQGVAEAQELANGLTQNGAVVGKAGAPVEIVEYLDLQCPFCRQASEEVIPQLVDEFIRPGKAKMELKTLGLLGPASILGARGAAAAEEQNAVLPFTEVMFANQGEENGGWLTEDLMNEVATALGLNAEKFAADVASEASAAGLRERELQAQADGTKAVPFFVITGPNGRETISGADTIDAFREAIESVS
jgi:protein-disulfide isomerase